MADEIEDEIQTVLLSNPTFDNITHEKIGTLRNIRNAGDLYIAFLKESLPGIDLRGKKSFWTVPTAPLSDRSGAIHQTRSRNQSYCMQTFRNEHKRQLRFHAYRSTSK
jgi:hypothetical protein